MQIQLQPSKSILAANNRFVLTSKDLQAIHSTPSQSDKYPCDNHSRTKMHDLPDDILILIFSSCDIDTLFTLRLTCTSFCAVIQAYIETIAPSSARATFPECDLLLTPPKNRYTLRWLRNLIPAQLASITLDKDKLRRHPYVNSGFLYGIPSESDCTEATYWRQRLTNGWRVLRSFHLISARVYSSCDDELKRPNAFRKVSGGVRTSRLWQSVTCQYAGCTEHGMKHLFDSKHRRDSHGSHNEAQKDLKDPISEVRRKEAQILRRRLAHVKTLSDQDLLDYVYLWRLLLHVFRPYNKPETTVWQFTQGWSSSTPIPRPNWPTIISDIAQGCSWLNWLILHIGTAPFLSQWSLSPQHPDHATSNQIRNTIWCAWNSRSTHQIEIEREYISKFEFALRKRCLSSERLKRLEAEISRGRSINTISLDCIPWIYDQHHRIPRPSSDFPWYEADRPVWLDGEWGVTSTPGTSWGQPGVLKGGMNRYKSNSRESEIDYHVCGPLAKVPYLVYLGTEEAGKLWPGSEGDGAELAF
ncbi:hypothetical protein BU25DRAFT_57964 [Macroventuria anomochaeta]|uniref:Uncharacterized protein n=1 Tax=Macroventuria anomochaeta TaxID=301207 RepID=A0ACB6S0B8_9PLEO|nr:uncharacterized protein BU25DRAFT_57964 [Macroventuria anomochaeta]KAF2627675.1 hypothetical protein BU25DRAFT_57964 [Macroventuria anomochaeta]